MPVTPGEIVAACAALLTLGGTGLGLYVRSVVKPVADSSERTSRSLEKLTEVLARIEDAALQHTQAGKTWAKATHRSLINAGIKDAPDPDDYPGI